MFLSNKKGDLGEVLGRKYLVEIGYTILDQNFRANHGEIDIIAIKNDVLTFVEVKTWDVLGDWDLSLVIDSRKIKRIVNASRVFIRNYKGSYSSLSYDVILFQNNARTLEHYINILME